MKNNYQKLLLKQKKELHYIEQFKFTMKDKRILSELFKNARTPLSRVSKKVELSRQATDYRIRRMIKKGFLQSFTTIINLSKLDYTNYFSLLSLNRFDKELENRLSRLIKAEKSVIKATKYTGRWNILIESLHQKDKEFHAFFRKIKQACSESLIDFEICQGIKQYKYITLPTEYLKPVDVDPNATKRSQIDSDAETITLDSTDRKILISLAKNCRTDLKQLNEGIKEDAIRKRIKELEEKGVIEGYVPTINPTGLQLHWHELLFKLKNDITSEEEKRFVRFLQEQGKVSYVMKMGEYYDYRVYLWVESQEKFDEFITDLKNNLSELIVNFDYLYGLKEYKFNEFFEE